MAKHKPINLQTGGERERETERGEGMVEGLRKKGMMGMEGKRRMDAMDLAFTLFVPCWVQFICDVAPQK